MSFKDVIIIMIINIIIHYQLSSTIIIIIINHHQSSIINHHHSRSTIINHHHQPSSFINHNQPSSSTIISHQSFINHQPSSSSSTIINHHHQPSSFFAIFLNYYVFSWGSHGSYINNLLCGQYWCPKEVANRVYTVYTPVAISRDGFEAVDGLLLLCNLPSGWWSYQLLNRGEFRKQTFVPESTASPYVLMVIQFVEILCRSSFKLSNNGVFYYGVFQ